MSQTSASEISAGETSAAFIERNGIRIDDTFAEAFPMRGTRLIVTGVNPTWVRHAAQAATGFATSVIGCGVEAGIERELTPDETPDGRPGAALLFFAMSGSELAKQVELRVGQCILTSPTSAVYAGLDEGEAIALGRNLRFFGDGWQIAKVIDGVRYWRIPVMEGEFVAQETTRVTRDAVGGGNLLLLARDVGAALAGAEAAVEAMRRVPGVVMPFPGGVVRSGSKVGSKYKALFASTNDLFCPSIANLVPETEMTADVRATLEIVIDGLTEADVAAAMRAGLDAIIARGGDAGVTRVSAGNYGGKLGPFHFHLHRLLGEKPDENPLGEKSLDEARPT